MKKITLVLVIVLFSITFSYNVFSQTNSDVPYDDGDGPVINNYTDYMWLQNVLQGGSLNRYDAQNSYDDFKLVSIDDFQIANVDEIFQSVDHITFLLSLGDTYYHHRRYYWPGAKPLAIGSSGYYRIYCWGQDRTKYIRTIICDN